MSIRSITSWVSSLATIERPSGLRNASSAANDWLAGTAPTAVGKRHQTFPARSTTSSLALPRSAMRNPPGNAPAPGAAGAVDARADADPAGDPPRGVADPLPTAPGRFASAWAEGTAGPGVVADPCPHAATKSRIAPAAGRTVRHGRRDMRPKSFMPRNATRRTRPVVRSWPNLHLVRTAAQHGRAAGRPAEGALPRMTGERAPGPLGRPGPLSRLRARLAAYGCRTRLVVDQKVFRVAAPGALTMCPSQMPYQLP